jgi:broad specificity phosphatase PhoE
MTSLDHRIVTPTEGERLICLLRHGETVWNVQKRIQGQKDSLLTDVGKKQTLTWARQLRGSNWQHILASDLGRVQETVALLNSELNLPISFDPRLREQHWGEWEGLPLADLARLHAQQFKHQVDSGWNFQPPGGESRSAVNARALAALEDAVERFSGMNILVVSHQGLIKCLIYHIAGRAFLPSEPALLEKNCLHILASAQGKFRLHALNIIRWSEA